MSIKSRECQRPDTSKVKVKSHAKLVWIGHNIFKKDKDSNFPQCQGTFRETPFGMDRKDYRKSKRINKI